MTTDIISRAHVHNAWPNVRLRLMNKDCTLDLAVIVNRETAREIHAQLEAWLEPSDDETEAARQGYVHAKPTIVCAKCGDAAPCIPCLRAALEVLSKLRGS